MRLRWAVLEKDGGEPLAGSPNVILISENRETASQGSSGSGTLRALRPGGYWFNRGCLQKLRLFGGMNSERAKLDTNTADPNSRSVEVRRMLPSEASRGVCV